MIGKTLLHYQIGGQLGRGGMGEVWRATDTTLGRDVAIKILPAAFASDPERLARFEREAKLLGSLNHPNIATVHGFHEAGGVRFLAMELVPGEDLAERLAKGPIALDEALDIARQTAEALEAAHEQGVVHRDLKPANVKVTAEGRVKVLDFGLAKSSEPAAAPPSSDGRLSPTITSLGTVAGVIVGTAAYMSPEQARAKPVDKRTDVWALGCLLFEMLSGKRPFEGETTSDTLAAVLTKDPDWTALPAATPARIRGLLGRCFEKDPKRRLRDIGEARIELENALSGRASSGELRAELAPTLGASPSQPRTPLTFILGALAVAALSVAAWSFLRPAAATAVPARLARLHVERPPDTEGRNGAGSFALAPDGSAVVFVVAAGTNVPHLWVRELDDLAGRDLAGTEGGILPFWAPDSRHIAFFANGRLMRVPRAGGSVQTICEVPTGRGGTWGADGTIVFAADPYSALSKVSADGGAPTPATRLDEARGERSHRFPAFLPDGRRFTYLVQPEVQPGLSQIAVASLDDPAGKPLLLALTAVRYAPPGYMLFARDQAIVAQRIDLSTLKMTGEIIPLSESPDLTPRIIGAAGFDAASDGTIVYDELDRRPTAGIWLARDGRRLGNVFASSKAGLQPVISPVGDRVAFLEREGVDASVAVVDLATGALTHVVRPERKPRTYAWSPVDGRLTLTLGEGVRTALISLAADGGAEREGGSLGDTFVSALSIAPDGTLLVRKLVARGTDLLYLPQGKGTELASYLTTPANEWIGVFSPDGRWLAYSSDDSGRNELYVDSFPVRREARRVSSGGVSQYAAWRGDGRELFYIAGDGHSVMACDVGTAPALSIGAPHLLYELPEGTRGWAPMPRGDRFLVLQAAGERRTALTLVQNWPAQLRK